jgi:four helix bundle protein
VQLVEQKGPIMLVAYDVSLDLIRSVRPVVESIAARDKDLANQLQRAATSVCLNLAEGSRRSKGDQRRFYGYANGSAMEVRAAIEAAEAWGWIGDVERPRQLLDRLLGLLWGLTH